MKNHGKFLYNTAVLTVSNVVMRCISLAFQIWLAGRIGSAGIGLFQLVMSVGGFAMTFAISGIRFGTTRLVAEELGAKVEKEVVVTIEERLFEEDKDDEKDLVELFHKRVIAINEGVVVSDGEGYFGYENQ